MENPKYGKEAIEIRDEFEDIKEKLQQIWVDNETLPESERIDIKEFELNVDELSRMLWAQSLNEEAERDELKMHLKEKKEEAMLIRKMAWDNLLVKGRSLKGIHCPITVDNYPLLPYSEEEIRRLQQVTSQRISDMELEEITEHLQYHWSNKDEAMNQPQSSPIPSYSLTPTLGLFESYEKKCYSNKIINDDSKKKERDSLEESMVSGIEDLEDELSIDVNNLDLLKEDKKTEQDTISHMQMIDPKTIEFKTQIGLKNDATNVKKVLESKNSEDDPMMNAISALKKGTDNVNTMTNIVEEENKSYQFFGSSSHMLINLQGTLLINQCKITSRRQSYQQIVLLKEGRSWPSGLL